MSIYSETPKHTTEQLMAVLRKEDAEYQASSLIALAMEFGKVGGRQTISSGEFLLDVARVMALIDLEYDWDEFSGVYDYEVSPAIAANLFEIENRFTAYEDKDLSLADWNEIAAMIRSEIEDHFD